MATGADIVGGEAPRALPAALLRGLDRVLEALVVVCITGIFLDILAQVISRYVFNAPFTWTEELGQQLFIYLIFLGLPLALRQERHVAIGVLAGRLGPRGRAVLDGLIAAVVAHTLVMLMVSGADLVRLLGGIMPALGWPTWTKNVVIPGAAGVALLYMVVGALAQRRGTLARLLAIAAGLLSWWLVHRSGLVVIPRTSPTLVMMIAFAVTLLMGVPVAFSMLFAAFLANWGANLLPPPAVVQNMVSGSGKFLLLAIPLFLTAGHLMNAGSLARRIMDLAFKLVGHMRGGLAQVNVVNSLLMSGVSGSSSADVAVDSKILVPQMVRNGYSAAFSCAITAASGILPNIIPPSIALLLFASIAEVSVGQLFVAGIGPGLLIGAALMGTVAIMSHIRGYGISGPRAPRREVFSALVNALPVLGLAVTIIVGLRFGVVSATECGIIAVVWALVLGMAVYREFGFRDLYGLLAQCAVDVALVGLLIGVAAPFAWILTAERIPQQFVAFVLHYASEPWVILMLFNALMLFAGTFLDLTPSMLILVPIFMPLMVQIGVDPVHLGLIMVVNLMIGGITPPLGLLVFVTGSITRTPINAIFREAVPFFVALVLALMVITYVPAVPMALVHLVY